MSCLCKCWISNPVRDTTYQVLQELSAYAKNIFFNDHLHIGVTLISWHERKQMILILCYISQSNLIVHELNHKAVQWDGVFAKFQNDVK